MNASCKAAAEADVAELFPKRRMLVFTSFSTLSRSRLIATTSDLRPGTPLPPSFSLPSALLLSHLLQPLRGPTNLRAHSREGEGGGGGYGVLTVHPRKAAGCCRIESVQVCVCLRRESNSRKQTDGGFLRRPRPLPSSTYRTPPLSPFLQGCKFFPLSNCPSLGKTSTAGHLSSPPSARQLVCL